MMTAIAPMQNTSHTTSGTTSMTVVTQEVAHHLTRLVVAAMAA